MQRYPFEPMFLLEEARKIREAVRIPVAYVGGVLALKDMKDAVERSCDFVQVGRAVIRDPGFVNTLSSGQVRESDCDQCNRFIAAMATGGMDARSMDVAGV